MRHLKNEGGVPLGLVLLEDLALGVVAHVHDVDETAQIELFGSKLGHGDGIENRWLVVDRDEVESCNMRQEALVWGAAGFRRRRRWRAGKRRRRRNGLLSATFSTSLPNTAEQSSDTPMKHFEPNGQIHLAKIPPPHTAGQAISSLSATSRWRPSLHHQT